MADDSKKYATFNMFEIAAIKFVSGIEPDEFMVEGGSRLGVAVYHDKSKLPPRADIQTYIEFSMQYSAVKRHIFNLVDSAIKEGEKNNVRSETDRTA
jgi:hypothetical protein